MMTTATALDERDTALRADLLVEHEKHEKREGPRVGDYVVWREQDGERVYRRVAHDWGEDVQAADGGSFHLGRWGVTFSGALHPSVPTSDLLDTGETMSGSVWFWHHGMPGAGNGVDTVVPFRVWAYVGERRVREALARWADDEDATPCKHEHILHLVDTAGVEVGNVPLVEYGGPIEVGRALRDWERLTGVSAIAASAVVTVQGKRATHYGVRVLKVGWPSAVMA